MNRLQLSGRTLFAAMALWLGAVPPAPAAEDLPLPRFVSLRSGEVNLRTGPGTSYPVEWVLVRRGMPVEVLAEFDIWRKIRDWEGTVGWVHQSMLAGTRTAVVTGKTQLLLDRPDGKPKARLEQGVIGKLVECEPGWCRLEVGGYGGWLRRSEFFGVYRNEALR